MAHSVLSELLR